MGALVTSHWHLNSLKEGYSDIVLYERKEISYRYLNCDFVILDWLERKVCGWLPRSNYKTTDSIDSPATCLVPSTWLRRCS